MRFKSTIVYLIAALVLVGYYLYETTTEKKKKEAKEEAKKFFEIKADQLKAITLTKNDHVIRLEKSGATEIDTWRITSPVQAKTEDFTVTQVRDGLVELKYDQVIADKAEDLTQFGLDKPNFTISFDAGKKKGSLFFGHKTPLQAGFYVIKDDRTKIYTVKDNDKAALDKSLFELRDKRLFTLESDKVKRFVIDRASGKWVLERKEGKWIFNDDEDFKVDKDKVESAVRRLTWKEAASFEKESTNDLKPFGLDQPKTRILLSDGEKHEEMILGNFVDDQKKEKIYAKMIKKLQIVTVDQYFLKDLPETEKEIKAEEKKEGKKETEKTEEKSEEGKKVKKN